MATLDGCPLAIEVRNTHAVDFEKQEWLERIGHTILEISVADLTLLPPDEIVDALSVRLFQSADFSEWLVHAKEKDAQVALDRLEEQVRAAHRSEEEALIARLETEEAERKRKEEVRKRFRDIEDFKLRVGRSTIRLGRNAQRVSLKAHGSAPEDVFNGLNQLARKHKGRFNGYCWEFYRPSKTEAFFKQLAVELQEVCIGRLYGISSTVTHSPRKKWLPEPVVDLPLPVYFQDEGLQEAFEERAAIFEFEAHLTRQEAEAMALASVKKDWDGVKY